MKDITLAIIYAAKKHDGQTRKNKTPYIYHPIRIADQVKNNGCSETVQITAILHDILEDTNTEKSELTALFGEEIANAVDLLTRKPGIQEEVYISNILTNEIATAVKEADKIDNILECMANLQTDKDKQFAFRYVYKAQKCYKGRFSEKLDKVIETAMEKLDETISYNTDSLPDFSDNRMQFFEIWNTYCCTLHLDDCKIGEENECWVYNPTFKQWNKIYLDIIDHFEDISIIHVNRDVLPELKII